MNHSAPRLLMILMVSIFASEFGIMTILSALPPLTSWVEATLDAIGLCILLFPVVFFGVFRPLTHRFEECRRIGAALRVAHGHLELRVQQRTAELEQRNREIGLLADVNSFLQACATLEEAYDIVAHTGEQLFPGTSGTLFTYSASRDELEAVATWGDPLHPNERVFTPADCWALRRGRVHLTEGTAAGLSCRHTSSPLAGRSLCSPVVAHGEVLGLLQVRGIAPLPEQGNRTAPFSQQLVVTLTEQVALALTNLKLRDTLLNQSIRDPLTGLFNRRYMEETLERELRRAERTRLPLGVVMLDLDQLKRLNDTFGHEAGNVLLGELGGLLKMQVRSSDIACRYGGDEFLLIVPDTPLETVRQRTEALRLAIKQLNVRYGDRPLGVVTVSGGVAVFPEHGTTAQALLGAADRALYRAKTEGRDRMVTADTPAVDP